MYTNRSIVSKVMNTLKLNNKDEHTSRRYVLKILQDTATVLISQKWLERTILSDINLYTKIECFEFEQVEVVRCPLIEFRTCKVLMRSKKPLPKLVFSRLGASIKDILSIDGGFRFTFVDKSQYSRNKKRQHTLKNEVYLYLDSDLHMYIPDHEIYTLDLNILTTKPEDANDCSACSENKCVSKWEAEFKCPDKLLDALFTQTLQVLGINRQITEDKNPNNVQGN